MRIVSHVRQLVQGIIQGPGFRRMDGVGQRPAAHRGNWTGRSLPDTRSDVSLVASALPKMRFDWVHGDPELAAGLGGSERRLSRWHSARAFPRRAAATLDSAFCMLLAVQKSLAETMKGCKSAMLGKAKAKSDGQSKPLAKTRSCRPSGTRASVRTSCSRSRSMCISKACLVGIL